MIHLSRFYYRTDTAMPMKIPDSLETLILSHANLLTDAMTAYREQDFSRAIDLLNRAIDVDKNNWHARLYLGMSYFNRGEIFIGASHFRFLKDHCPDKNIRAKAIASLDALTTKSPVRSREPYELQPTEQNAG